MVYRGMVSRENNGAPSTLGTSGELLRRTTLSVPSKSQCYSVEMTQHGLSIFARATNNTSSPLPFGIVGMHARVNALTHALQRGGWENTCRGRSAIEQMRYNLQMSVASRGHERGDA